MASLGWPSTILLVEEMKSGSRQISKLKQRFTFGRREVGKGRFCSREVVQAADGSMRVGQPANIKSLDFVPPGKLRQEQSGDAYLSDKNCHVLGAGSSWVFEPVKADPICQDLYQSCRVVSTRLRYLTYKRRIEWSGWPRLTQISLCPYAKFLWIRSALCLMEMPVVETPVLKEHKLGM